MLFLFLLFQNPLHALKGEVKLLFTQSCLTLYDFTDCVACQAPLTMGFSRQEYSV